MNLGNNSMRRTAMAAVLAMTIGAAYAHVTIQPKQSAASASVKYTMRVPTEKFVPTVRIDVEFPAGLTVSSVEAKTGWKIEEKKDSGGKLTGATLTGSIPPGESSEFNFLARNSSGAGKLAWRVVQIYEDGSKSEWTGAEGSRTPAPVTEISR